MTATFAETVSSRLDELEAALPEFPARVLRLQRELAEQSCQRVNAVVEAITEAVKRLLDTAAQAGRTFTDQARTAAGDAVGTVASGVRSVVDQAQTQGQRVSSAASTEATKLVDKAIDAVDDTPGSGTPYEEWTKAELVERAKELRISGPTRMSKSELIDALRAA